MMTILGGTVYGLTMNGTIIGGGPGRFSPGGRASDEQRAWEKMITASGRHSLFHPDTVWFYALGPDW